MKRLVIAVDCDDVLINTTEYIMRQYDKRYGIKVDLENAYTLSHPQFDGEELDTIYERFNEIFRAEEFQTLKPRADAVEVVQRLGCQHELHLVTARLAAVELITLTMINEYFPGCFTEINHISERGSKGEVCRVLKADVIIDDNAKHLEDAKSCGVKQRIWFGSYPWQKPDAGSQDFTARCADWYEVEQQVNYFANEGFR